MSVFKPIVIKIHCVNFNESIFLYHLKSDASIFEIHYECARAIRHHWSCADSLRFEISLVDSFPSILRDLEIIDY